MEAGSPEYFRIIITQQKEAINYLINKNAHLREALLLIREHKLPYPSFSMDVGSNGVRDHFIKIASNALDAI